MALSSLVLDRWRFRLLPPENLIGGGDTRRSEAVPGGSIMTEGPDAADAPHTSTGDELDPRLQDPRVRAWCEEHPAEERRSEPFEGGP
jgi:hypothetical protein